MIMHQIFKYGLASVLGYGLVVGGNFLLVEWLSFDPRWSYFLVLLVVYPLMYIMNERFVFSQKGGSREKVFFVCYLLLFWLINNIFFNLLYLLGWHYLYIIVFNIILFSSLRFLSLKLIIFKKNNDES